MISWWSPLIHFNQSEKNSELPSDIGELMEMTQNSIMKLMAYINAHCFAHCFAPRPKG